MFREILQTIRSLARNPVLAAAVVLVLALGVGAATTAFSVAYGVMIRPLPYGDPDRIFQLRETHPAKEWGSDAVADGNYLDWRENSRSFASLAAYLPWYFNLTGEPGAERLGGLYVSQDFFAVLGVSPRVGRHFGRDETAEAADVVVLSHELWQRRYAGSEEVVGRSITVDGDPHVVAGVMPPDFVFPSPSIELWSLLSFSEEDAANRTDRSIRVIGRLADGVGEERARAELQTIAARLAGEHPESNDGWSVALESLHQAMVHEARPQLLVLLGSVACLLLLACVNAAGILFARAEARLGEVALRRALGAGTLYVVRLPFFEGLLLSLAGGALGLLFAHWGLAIVTGLGSKHVPRLHDIRLDPGVLLFAAVLAVFTGLAVGALAAWRVFRRAPGTLLTLASPRQGRRGIGRSLVVVEVALSLTLLTAAGLMAQSLWKLSRVETGFEVDHLLVLSLSLSGERYWDQGEVLGYFQRASEGLRSLPEVRSVGWTSAVPLSGGGWRHGVIFEDRSDSAAGEAVTGHKVVDNYFSTVGLRMVAGRGFLESDRASEVLHVVVNETFAERFFAGRDPIGQRIKRGKRDDDKPWKVIVGVVEDERHAGIGVEPEPEIYEPHDQQPFPYMSLVLRTEGDPLQLAEAVRSRLREADPEQPVYGLRTMKSLAEESIAVERTAGWMLGFFALLSLLLAGTGLYGLMTVELARRRHEMGVRIAVGAGRGRVRRLVLLQGMALVVAGAVAGLVVSLWTSRFLSSLLYGVGALDPRAFVCALLTLLAVGLLACYLPIRRALRADPLQALRVV
ncbi:MAG: ABC transporter permease [Acidobacteriota bacterium]